jgi:hypothetical protein
MALEIDSRDLTNRVGVGPVCSRATAMHNSLKKAMVGERTSGIGPPGRFIVVELGLKLGDEVMHAALIARKSRDLIIELGEHRAHKPQEEGESLMAGAVAGFQHILFLFVVVVAVRVLGIGSEWIGRTVQTTSKFP